MSKALLDDVDKLQWRSPAELKDDFGVSFMPGTVSPLIPRLYVD